MATRTVPHPRWPGLKISPAAHRCRREKTRDLQAIRDAGACAVAAFSLRRQLESQTALSRLPAEIPAPGRSLEEPR